MNKRRKPHYVVDEVPQSVRPATYVHPEDDPLLTREEALRELERWVPARSRSVYLDSQWAKGPEVGRLSENHHRGQVVLIEQRPDKTWLVVDDAGPSLGRRLRRDEAERRRDIRAEWHEAGVGSPSAGRVTRNQVLIGRPAAFDAATARVVRRARRQQTQYDRRTDAAGVWLGSSASGAEGQFGLIVQMGEACRPQAPVATDALACRRSDAKARRAERVALDSLNCEAANLRSVAVQIAEGRSSTRSGRGRGRRRRGRGRGKK